MRLAIIIALGAFALAACSGGDDASVIASRSATSTSVSTSTTTTTTSTTLALPAEGDTDACREAFGDVERSAEAGPLTWVTPADENGDRQVSVFDAEWRRFRRQMVEGMREAKHPATTSSLEVALNDVLVEVREPVEGKDRALGISR